MAFDPDKYLAEKQSEFNPDAYLASKPSQVTPATPEQSGGALQTAGDLVRGGVQSASIGFSDEAIGGARALKDIISDPSKIQDFLKLYRQHQQEEQTLNEEAAKRSPIAYNVGDYGTSIGLGLLTGGIAPVGKLGLKGLMRLAGKGAAIGGAEAFGRSTNTMEENPSGLAGDTLTGSTAGAVLAPAVGAIFNRAPKNVKLAEIEAQKIQQSPFKAGAAEAWKTGTEGQGFNKSQKVLSREKGKLDTAVSGITKTFDDAEDILNKEKAKLFDVADNSVVVRPRPEKTSQIPLFSELTSKSAEAKRALGNVVDDIELYKQGGLSPRAAETARLKLKDAASNVQDPNVRASIYNMADELKSETEKVIPGLEKANSDIHQFLTRGRETLLSRGSDQSVSHVNASDISSLTTEQRLKELLGSLRNYKENATLNAQGAVDKTMQGLGTLFEENPELAKKIGINLPKLQKQIYTAADETTLRNKLIPGALGDIKPGAGLLGIPSFGEKGVLKGLNLAGQLVKKGSDLYRLPKEGLMDAAAKLQNSGVPGLSSVGEGLLKAISTGDQHKTNATLFTILQNPSARKFLGYSPENEAKGDNFGQ